MALLPELLSNVYELGVYQVLRRPELLRDIPDSIAHNLGWLCLDRLLALSEDLRNVKRWTEGKWERLLNGRLFPCVPRHLYMFHQGRRRNKISARALVNTAQRLSLLLAETATRLEMRATEQYLQAMLVASAGGRRR